MRGWERALGGCALVLLLVCSAADVLAAPDVATRAADDGTMLVVGSGWRPGQQLLVTIGRDRYTAQADSAGAFELRTVVPFAAAEPAALSVRSVSEPLRFAGVPPPAALPTGSPSPFAVLFAYSLATGAAWLTLGASGVAAAAISRRMLRSWRATLRASTGSGPGAV